MDNQQATQEIIDHSNQSHPVDAQTHQSKQQQVHNQIAQEDETHDNKSDVSQEQIPEHFYDSDMASVCEKDFMSDNEPPKDIIQERKRLYKEKLLHVFKTIVRVGSGIDKPARYDWIKIRLREVEQEEIKKHAKQQKAKISSKQNDKEVVEQNYEHIPPQDNQINKKQDSNQQQPNQQQPVTSPLPPYYSTSYLENCPNIEYNIGNERQQIQRLVTSMKRGETAIFELQHLTVSKKSNIKIKTKTQIYCIQVFDWTTVIDLDGDKKLLKYVLTKGEGAFRVALFDKITFTYEIKRGDVSVKEGVFDGRRLQKEFIEEELPNVVWRVLTSMKDQQSVRLEIIDQDLKQVQGEQYYSQLQALYKQKHSQIQSTKQTSIPKQWLLTIAISKLIKVDDIHLDGRLLKQTIVRGVSTAKPQSSSLVYYALKFLDNDEKQLKVDECFDSDWWEDFGKLDELKGVRKSHLDDFTVSKMLRKVIKRMKPAEVALVECRDNEMFQYGQDYDELKQLLKFTQAPQIVKLMIRVYNFTQARTAFSMDIDEKIIQSRRKKQIALKLLSQNKIEKALKKFQSIVSFYSSQKINQQAYDEKVSALMNAILCYMKLKKYPEMINLCNEILLKPRHGHQVKDIKIVGPGHAKIEGSLPKKEGEQQQENAKSDDTRRIAEDLIQNQKIVDKCLYRKSFALVQMGECAEALKSLQQVSQGMSKTEEVQKLKKEAATGKTKYEQKSKKIFKSMFG